MSKKQQRVKYLVGIYDVLRTPLAGVEGGFEYDRTDIKRVLETLKVLLAEDGIQSVAANSKVDTGNA